MASQAKRDEENAEKLRQAQQDSEERQSKGGLELR